VSSNAYGALFRLSVVRWQMAAGLVAQMPQGAATVAIILIVRERTGSLALAGAVVSALWVAGGVARPLQGRLIDRQGATRVMAVCGVAHPAALASLVGLSRVQGLGWLLVLLGVIAGLALPPVSTSMRIEWAEIVSADERPAAYSLVYLTQELAILTGPLLLAAVIAASSASIALITIAALTALGTLAFAASIRTSSERRPSTRARASPLRAPGMQVLLAVALLLGGVIGAFQVAVATLAAAHRAPAAAGLLIATLSIGGVIGAAIYGTRRWRATPRWRLLFLLTLLTAPLALMTTTPSLVMIGVLVLFAGLPLNPALSTFSLLVDQYASPGSTGEAFGWLSTAIAAGTGGGSALAVVIAEHQHDPQAAFGAAALTGAAATALTFCLRRTLDQRSARTLP
jgi:predicted MFS family arabinose efflux permease